MYNEIRLGQRQTFSQATGLQVKEIEIHLSLYRFKSGWLTGHYVDDTLVAFGFVVNDARLKFDLRRFSYGQLTGTLGKTSFAALTTATPIDLIANAGAASAPAIYSEYHYFGNPGDYHTFALTRAENGVGGVPSLIVDAASALAKSRPKAGYNLGDVVVVPHEAQLFRRAVAPNAVAVSTFDYPDPLPLQPERDPGGIIGAVTLRRFARTVN